MKPLVDLILCFPDLICSSFVTETLLPLYNENLINRVLCKVGRRSEYAREELLHEFLNGDSEYVFIVDVDMILPPMALARLLGRNKKMITGLYFDRGEVPNYPCIFEPRPIEEWPQIRYLNYKQDSLIEVGACGHGCLLIHRSVLEAIKPPYSMFGPFSTESFVGSDIRLCLKARQEAGVTIYADTTVKCGHIRPMMITESDWLSHKQSGTEMWNRNLEKYLQDREQRKLDQK